MSIKYWKEIGSTAVLPLRWGAMIWLKWPLDDSDDGWTLAGYLYQASTERAESPSRPTRLFRASALIAHWRSLARNRENKEKKKSNFLVFPIYNLHVSRLAPYIQVCIVARSISISSGRNRINYAGLPGMMMSKVFGTSRSSEGSASSRRRFEPE